jgi:hypothetical protein
MSRGTRGGRAQRTPVYFHAPDNLDGFIRALSIREGTRNEGNKRSIVRITYHSYSRFHGIDDFKMFQGANGFAVATAGAFAEIDLDSRHPLTPYSVC